VFIVERVLPDQPGEGDLEALQTGLNMMVMVGGRERTAFEFDRLLAQAGLSVRRIIPAGTQYSIIETEFIFNAQSLPDRPRTGQAGPRGRRRRRPRQ
jgi:hypothetical protein